jgi:hypothetical protein
MAAPLSPTPSAALNFSTPSSNLRHETYDARSYSINTTPQQAVGDYTENITNDDGDSSPFLSHIKDEITSPTLRGPSPPKARPGSRIISGHELSPLKILQQQQQSQIQAQTQMQTQQPQTVSDDASSPAKSMPPPPLPQSPRKMTAQIKRFPVKVSQPGSAASESPRRSLEERRPSNDSQTSPRDAVRENEGLKHAIEIFEDEVSAMHDDTEDGDNHGDDTLLMAHDAADQQDQMQIDEDEQSLADDTMISNFSSFSAVPNLTIMAQMRGDSPTRFSAIGGTTPRATPRTESMPPMRTPRGTNGSYDAGTATSLMDFTEQMRYGNYGAQPTPSRRGPMGSFSPNNGAATPQRPSGSSNLANLLDFDLPPMPTPRSVPSITPRELESLKSRFLSEISSLKASLSGKEAEVMSLKTAVGDAEKRVGQCLEQLREVEGTQEALMTEKDSWEQRGREMESVLRQVREEIVISQREREELEFKLDEADKRREAAEMMAQEAESKMAGMRAGKASAEAAAAAAADGKTPPVMFQSNKDLEISVERVARELHALYKNKHETKITALKKNYEGRWEKRVRGLEARVEELTREKEQLLHADRGSRDAALARVDPARLAALEEQRRAERARDMAHIRELEATVEKVEAVLKTVQADNADLRVLLERERVEKGELVQLAEEMMNMQQSFVAVPEEPEPMMVSAPTPAPAHYAPAPSAAAVAAAKTPSRRQSSSAPMRTTPLTARASMAPEGANGNATGGNNFRMSTGPNSFRASGLRAPGGMMGLKSAGAESRIGRVAAHERTKSAAVMGNGGISGMPRPGSGQGLRGGIMGSIEKMGSYGHGPRV